MIEENQQSELAIEKETNRLEAFSDGVFAVAITLLIFNVNVPPFPPDKIPTAVWLKDQISSQWPSYFAFFISFATILIMWVNHHNLFKLIYRSNTSFMFANGFLLLLITIVPFPTRLVAVYLMTPAASVACAVYAGIFVIANIAYNTLWWSAAYQHNLLRPGIPRSVVKAHTRNYLFGLPCYLLATVLAFWNPFVSIGICSVLWLFWAFTSYEGQSLRRYQKPEERI